MPPGFFISFEGGEGTGKTTQIEAALRFLSDKYAATDCKIIRTREPGGTPEAEKIRDLLLQQQGGNWTGEAEVLLFYAARVMHTEQLIKPALAAGHIVLSDRYADSTLVYQSFGRGFDARKIKTIHQQVLGDFAPNLTIILDIDPVLGLQRSLRTKQTSANVREQKEDRFEQLTLDFHQRIRHGFLEIARQNPGRCVVIDAAQPLEKVSADIERTLAERLRRHEQSL